MSSSRPKPSMSELKLRRLLEHNQRLREDLGRPRIRVSEASASIIRYCKTTTDHLVSFTPFLECSMSENSNLLCAECLVSSLYRYRLCGAPSAKPRIHTPHRPAVGVVTCSNQILYHQKTKTTKKSPSFSFLSSHRRAFLPFSFLFFFFFCVSCLTVNPEMGTPLATPQSFYIFFFGEEGRFDR